MHEPRNQPRQQEDEEKEEGDEDKEGGWSWLVFLPAPRESQVTRAENETEKQNDHEQARSTRHMVADFAHQFWVKTHFGLHRYPYMI